MSVEWREHRGERVLYVDYSDWATEEQMLETFEQQARLMRAHARPTLVLSDFAGTHVGSAFMERVKQGGSENAGLLRRNALLGITGLKGILLTGFGAVTGLGARIKAFEDERSALDWLVDD
jgi:hypothetical protein